MCQGIHRLLLVIEDKRDNEIDNFSEVKRLDKGIYGEERDIKDIHEW